MRNYTQTSQSLARLLEKRFALNKADLAAHLESLASRMPASLRRDLALVLEAETLSGHPRYARMIPVRQTEKAARRAKRALLALDVAAEKAQARRRSRAFLALNVLLGLAALIAVLAVTGVIGLRALS